MPQRVKPVMLVGLIATLVLSIALWAGANTGGASRDAAVGAAMGQVGMPYGFGTDGPGSFSCVGLVRHALRSAGVDSNAPWDHGAYLGAYPTVSSPQPGDVVVYPDGVAMYIGNDQVVMANEVDQVVGTYGMHEVGTPVGFASPYGGAVDPAAVQPAGSTAEDPAMTTVDPLIDGSLAVDPAISGDPMWDDSLAVDPAISGDPALYGSLAVDPAISGDPALYGSLAVDPAISGEPAVVDPLIP